MITRSSQLGIGVCVDSEKVFSKFESKTFEKGRLGVEKFIEINSEDSWGGDVGSFLVKTSMDVDVVLNHETDVPKSVNTGQFIPIWGVSIVNIERHGFSYLVTSSTNNQ